MDVDEVTHAFGIVFCRSPLSELDLAPGTMHVEENEEIDRPIATILAIVTFEPARRGRDWLTDLADELHGTFVEAHDRPLRIGRLGIEIKHVLHAGDVFAIDLRNAPHVFAPGFEVIFRQASPNRLVRQAVVVGELDYRTCQQLERPAGTALWGAGTGGRHQQGFFLAPEVSPPFRTRPLPPRPLPIPLPRRSHRPAYGPPAPPHPPGDSLLPPPPPPRPPHL